MEVNAMFRATTPLHTFTFPDDPATYKKILITYSQNGTVVFEKTEEDLTFTTETEDERTIYKGSLRLTQEEANTFSVGKYNSVAAVQVRVLDANDHAYASDIKYVNVKDVLDDQVLVDE